MPILDINIEFDFPINSTQFSATHQLTIDLDAPTYKELKEDIQNFNLTDEDELEEALYEVDNWVQQNLIFDKLRFSNHNLDIEKGILTFDIALTIDTTTFNGYDTIEDPDIAKHLTATPTPTQIDDFITDTYLETHHNFDILEITGTYTP